MSAFGSDSASRPRWSLARALGLVGATEPAPRAATALRLLAAVMLVTALVDWLAFSALFVALVERTPIKLAAAVLLAGLFGFLTFVADWTFVTTRSPQGGREVLKTVLRVVVLAGVTLVTAAPLDLMVAHREIQRRLREEHALVLQHQVLLAQRDVDRQATGMASSLATTNTEVAQLEARRLLLEKSAAAEQLVVGARGLDAGREHKRAEDLAKQAERASISARYATEPEVALALHNQAARAANDAKAALKLATDADVDVTNASGKLASTGVELALVKSKLDAQGVAASKAQGALDTLKNDARETLRQVRTTLERFLSGDGDGAVEINGRRFALEPPTLLDRAQTLMALGFAAPPTAPSGVSEDDLAAAAALFGKMSPHDPRRAALLERQARALRFYLVLMHLVVALPALTTIYLKLFTPALREHFRRRDEDDDDDDRDGGASELVPLQDATHLP